MKEKRTVDRWGGEEGVTGEGKEECVTGEGKEDSVTCGEERMV